VTYLTTGPATDCREPDDASAGLPDPDELQPADPPSVPSCGVGLSRLIGLARLTAPQALEIGASVLAEAAGRSEPDSGSPGSDQVVIEQVVIGTDGRVVLGPAADSRHDGRPSAAGPTGLAVEVVLGDVARAARLGARRTEPATEQLLVVLDRAVAELPVAGVPVVAEMLREAAAATDRRAVRAELAALVRAVGRSAGAASGNEPADDPSTVVRVAPAWPATSGQIGTARRRIGAWLLSVVVLAAVVLLEVAVLRDHIATDIRLLLGAGRSGSASSSPPEPDGPPIVPPAPAAAGSVTAVDLRLLAPCAPGAPCTMRLLVRLVPAADPQVVTWSYRIVDRCTGATVTDTAPGGSVTVPAGGERAAALGTVTLPAAHAVAVVAVTDAPAAAASPPAIVGSCPPD